MVTIKIQSPEDIIRAYFRNLGFSEAQLDAMVKIVMSGWGSDSKNGDELLQFMENTVLAQAKRIFPDTQLDDEQLVAQFKLGFILCNGAEKYSAQMLKTQKLPEELVLEMRNHKFSTAPEYVLSEMQPQEFVTAEPKKLLHKLFGYKKD